jgi:hypothetical protein
MLQWCASGVMVECCTSGVTVLLRFFAVMLYYIAGPPSYEACSSSQERFGRAVATPDVLFLDRCPPTDPSTLTRLLLSVIKELIFSQISESPS